MAEYGTYPGQDVAADRSWNRASTRLWTTAKQRIDSTTQDASGTPSFRSNSANGIATSAMNTMCAPDSGPSNRALPSTIRLETTMQNRRDASRWRVRLSNGNKRKAKVPKKSSATIQCGACDQSNGTLANITNAPNRERALVRRI